MSILRNMGATVWGAFLVTACTRLVPPLDPGIEPKAKMGIREAGQGMGGAAPSAAPGSLGARDDLPYRCFDSEREAIVHIVSHTKPRIIGFGEYHSRIRTNVPSALSHFTASVFPAIAPLLSDLVVEALVPEGRCQALEETVAAAVEAETERPESTKDETVVLFQTARAKGVVPHYLTLTCADHRAIYADNEVGYLLLLETIGAKLANKTMAVMGHRASRPVERKPLISVYGGAVHNDACPDPRWRSVAFGPRLTREVPPGKYVEVDLAVPEIVEDNPLLRDEPWIALARDKSSPDKTLLIEQSDTSYIIVFPRKEATP